MYESHPIIHALLSNALKRASLHDQFSSTAALIRLIHGDAVDGLTALVPSKQEGKREGSAFHAAYLDPMYPLRASHRAQKSDAILA